MRLTCRSNHRKRIDMSVAWTRIKCVRVDNDNQRINRVCMLSLSLIGQLGLALNCVYVLSIKSVLAADLNVDRWTAKTSARFVQLVAIHKTIDYPQLFHSDPATVTTRPATDNGIAYYTMHVDKIPWTLWTRNINASDSQTQQFMLRSDSEVWSSVKNMIGHFFGREIAFNQG